jgi:hypothetical protein
VKLIDSRITGNGSVNVYAVQDGFAIMVVRNDGTQVHRSTKTYSEATMVQSELFLAEPTFEDKYADSMYDE